MARRCLLNGRVGISTATGIAMLASKAPWYLCVAMLSLAGNCLSGVASGAFRPARQQTILCRLCLTAILTCARLHPPLALPTSVRALEGLACGSDTPVPAPQDCVDSMTLR